MVHCCCSRDIDFRLAHLFLFGEGRVSSRVRQGKLCLDSFCILLRSGVHPLEAVADLSLWHVLSSNSSPILFVQDPLGWEGLQSKVLRRRQDPRTRLQIIPQSRRSRPHQAVEMIPKAKHWTGSEDPQTREMFQYHALKILGPTGT